MDMPMKKKRQTVGGMNKISANSYHKTLGNEFDCRHNHLS